MHPQAMFKTEKYRSKGQPGIGGIKIGDDKKKYFLILSNAC